jgi:NADPH:quinone reductase
VIADGELTIQERPTPRPAADQVLVEVAGAGINRADLLQLRGGYPAPPGWPDDVPGLEVAGTVAATGDGVRSLEEGARVFGIVGGGAHSTHVLTREALCAEVPDDMDLVEAGGVPEAFVTAWDAMVVQAGLTGGERVLVHGVGSGVGTAAVQIARALGAFSVGTARTPAKLGRARDLGLDEAVAAGPGMREAIGEVDVVVDLVGGDYLSLDLEVCRPRGRIVIVGLLAGSHSDLDMGALMQKRLTITGTVLRSRPEHEKALAVAAFAKGVAPLLASGRVHPVIDKVIALDDVATGYGLVRSNETFGKVVLTPGG